METPTAPSFHRRCVYLSILIVVLFSLFDGGLSSAFAATEGTFPGVDKVVVNKPPAAGEDGAMTYLFKSKVNIESLQVSILLPDGCSPLEGTSLIKKIGKVPAGKVVKIPCLFHCDQMGIFRVGAKATAYASVLDGGTSTKYVFFEAGETKGYSPVIKPVNRWQRRVETNPGEDEFVQVARNVYKSNTRVSTTKGTFQVDRYPVLPTVGNLSATLDITAPPLIKRPVRLIYEFTVKENLRRRNSPCEIIFLFPHDAFRVLNVVWPEGGDYELMEDGFSWKGTMPSENVIRLTADIMALTPGEGKIRALARVQGRGDQYTIEEALLVRVNKRSAQIVKSKLP